MVPQHIEISGQFGGLDAEEAALSHFNALKAAARRVGLEGYPLPVLAFILRVDGKINQYDLSGPGYIDLDKDGEYLSVDIGIPVDKRSQLVNFLSESILSSVEIIHAAAEKHSLKIDIKTLQRCLADFVARYREEVAK